MIKEPTHILTRIRSVRGRTLSKIAPETSTQMLSELLNLQDPKTSTLHKMLPFSVCMDMFCGPHYFEICMLFTINMRWYYCNNYGLLFTFMFQFSKKNANITETEMSSFWWNFHHWLHWKLSKWQLPVQPVIKISSKWRHFRFSDVNWELIKIWWNGSE